MHSVLQDIEACLAVQAGHHAFVLDVRCRRKSNQHPSQQLRSRLLISLAVTLQLIKELDQTATTQAYVSGMREDLSLYGNELVNFNTFFSIGYAIGLVPGQVIQTKVRPSLFLPCCEITWGLLVLL